MAPPPSLKLNDGRQIPMLAFGTGIANVHAKRAETGIQVDQDVVDSVKAALREGYRHLDTAERYGTENELGIAIRESIDEGVISSRGDLFITSKVQNDPINEAEKAIDRTLQRLGDAVGGYLDLYLIHSPYFAESESEIQLAWAAMERVHASGKARSIGVSNFEARHLTTLLATAKIPPVIDQIEFNPYMSQRGGVNVLDLVRQHAGIAVSVYGALAPATNRIEGPLDDVLARLAKKYGVNPGVVCARWCIDQNVVVITTSTKPARMREYLSTFDFALEPDEVEEITKSGVACLKGEELKPRVVRYYEEQKAKAG